MPNGVTDQQPQSAQAMIQPLPAERLYRRADLSGLEFEPTAELAPLLGLVNQPRAHEAISFGTEIGQRGFNI